jgi:endoglucanase
VLPTIVHNFRSTPAGLAFAALAALAAVDLGGCSDPPGAVGDAGSPGAGPDGGPGSVPAAGRLRISGAKIVDAHGTAVRLTGVNWFGLETDTYAPHGLAQRSMTSLLDQIKTLGFNVIRVPFSSQLFDAGSTPNGIDTTTKNPELAGKTGPEILDLLISHAGERGLRIILDRHRPDSGAQSALWYTPAYSEDRWIKDWVALASRYKANPTVVAFDLHNEPHSPATWGDGSMANDWRLAAQRAGNAILAVDPDALLIVEGIDVVDKNFYWQGGNLRGAKTAPVQLSAADHVIYSPHDYPATIYPQPWFSAADYPNNLAPLWDATWGYLAETAPVLVGEFGTKLQTDSDRKWIGKLTGYIKDHQLSFTFWTLNPDSGDTGGILADDWTTVNQDKMAFLTPLLGPLLPVQ